MNTDVVRCDISRNDIAGDRIELELDNGLVMQLEELVNGYESMQVSVDGKTWVI